MGSAFQFAQRAFENFDWKCIIFIDLLSCFISVSLILFFFWSSFYLYVKSFIFSFQFIIIFFPFMMFIFLCISLYSKLFFCIPVNQVSALNLNVLSLNSTTKSTQHFSCKTYLLLWKIFAGDGFWRRAGRIHADILKFSLFFSFQIIICFFYNPSMAGSSSF